ncbi:MAG: hypothetical protein WA694_13240 [Pseudolabrys sp.]
MANLQNLKPFQKGHKKLGGRKKGVPNKNSRKAAFIAAAEQLGSDGQGTGGLTGYLMSVMKNTRHGGRLVLAVLNYEAKNPPKDLAKRELIKILDSPKLTQHEKLFLAQIWEKVNRTS